jgi:hypothetical protein
MKLSKEQLIHLLEETLQARQGRRNGDACLRPQCSRCVVDFASTTALPA